MAQVVTRVRERLFERVRRAHEHVTLVSPFLSEPIANELAVCASASTALDLRLLTCLSSGATRAGVLSQRGLIALLEAGFEIRSVTDLHAKVWLVDGAWGLVGSGNLTSSGLGSNAGRSNAELGVELSANQIHETTQIVDRWWSQGTSLDAERILAMPGPDPSMRRGETTVGVSVGGTLPPELRTRRASGDSTGLWLKILHDAPGRYDSGYFGRRRMVNDRQRERSDGTVYYRPSYEVGDLMLVYVVQRGCPAILEVTRAAALEPHRVRDDPDALPDDWRRWTWVTEVRCVYERDLDEAPPFSTLGVPGASVSQQGRISLSRAQFDAGRRALLDA